MSAAPSEASPPTLLDEPIPTGQRPDRRRTVPLLIVVATLATVGVVLVLTFFFLPALGPGCDHIATTVTISELSERPLPAGIANGTAIPFNATGGPVGGCGNTEEVPPYLSGSVAFSGCREPPCEGVVAVYPPIGWTKVREGGEYAPQWCASPANGSSCLPVGSEEFPLDFIGATNVFPVLEFCIWSSVAENFSAEISYTYGSGS